jgi:hypothetical protein
MTGNSINDSFEEEPGQAFLHHCEAQGACVRFERTVL